VAGALNKKAIIKKFWTMPMLHAVDALFKTAVIFSWIYAAYHSWRYNQMLGKAMMEGTIPPVLLSGRMGFGWMIASPGVVPGGDGHRRKSMYGGAAFVALCAAYALFSVVVRH
jgi:hypothetical protein